MPEAFAPSTIDLERHGNKLSADIAEKELTTDALTPFISSTDFTPPAIYSIHHLAANPSLLHEIVSVINKAYRDKDQDFSSLNRFPNDTDLITQFGPRALCAAISSTVTNKIVATASLTPWREPAESAADLAFRKSRPNDIALVETGQSYEVKGVATLPSPATRQRGLATQCIDSLTHTILRGNGGSDILLWLHTAEHQNGPYWRRRGFEDVYVETKPRGYWGALEEFQFVTLVKRVKNDGS